LERFLKPDSKEHYSGCVQIHLCREQFQGRVDGLVENGVKQDHFSTLQSKLGDNKRDPELIVPPTRRAS
jgi:hypothetical protein